MIPAIASAIPEMVARSGRSPAFFDGLAVALAGASAAVGFAAAVVAMGSIASRRGIADRGCVVVEHSPPELHDAFHHLVGGLAHAENLTCGQCDHGIRSYVDVFDQIRVEDHRRAVQAG